MRAGRIAPMAKTRQADSRAGIRREQLQAFCIAKGWRHENGEWAITEIAKFFGKSKNKISDLLGGRGSFGGQIARDLEDASNGELWGGELDGLSDDGNFENVPRIDARLSGGDGSVEGFEEVIGNLKFASAFLRSIRVGKKFARVVDVRGHSMHPTIPDGAVVLIDTSESGKEPLDGEIFAIVRPVEGLSIKRLRRLDVGSWVATSDNPSGPTIPIGEGEPADVVGRARWMGAKL